MLSLGTIGEKLKNRKLVKFTCTDTLGQEHIFYLGKVGIRLTGKQYWTFVDDIKFAYPLRKDGGYLSYSSKENKFYNLQEVIESNDLHLICRQFGDPEREKDIVSWNIMYLQYEDFKHLIGTDKKEEE